VSDREALLAAIKAHPDADTPRLMFADWLEEHGEGERAAFIRLQIEHAQRDFPLEGCEDLLRRAQQLLRSTVCGSVPVEIGSEVYTHTIGIENDESSTDCIFQVFKPGSARDHYFIRGFVDRVVCPAADWLAHADAILAEHPVRRVRLTTVPVVVPVGDTLELLDPGTDAAAFWGGQGGPAVPSAYACELALKVLRERWPGIEFELPPPAPVPPVEVISTPFDFNAYFENAIAACAQALGVPAHLLAGGTSGYSGAALALSTWQQMHALNNFTQDAFEQAAPLPPAE